MRCYASLVFGLMFVGVLLIDISFSDGAVFYVAPGGNDANPGSLASPFGSIVKAAALVNPGDTIYVRGGTYSLNNDIQLLRAGTSGNPIRLWAYPGETPILDFAAAPPLYQALTVQNDWWHLKGITVKRSKSFGLWTNGSNNIFENMTFTQNRGSGFSMSGANGRIPTNNLILNCDSIQNYDVGTHGENADGFVAANLIGLGNVFHGCRAYGNSDDGWDLWQASAAVTIESCWSYYNGLNFWNDPSWQGDGNGFKLGRLSGAHVINNAMAWSNTYNGFDTNANGTGLHISNSVAYANNFRNWQIEDLPTHVLLNNISYGGGSPDWIGPLVTDAFNTWNGLSVSLADFLSTNAIAAQGPRLPDGSLPITDFLKLNSTSHLIDAGVPVGLPYFGLAPDLGSFETGAGSFTNAGDFNGDGKVDGADFAIWQDHYPTSRWASWSHGDADLDGDVDGADFVIWQTNYSASELTTLVPEPATVTLALTAIIAIAFAMWWKYSKAAEA
jgi:hypothetical protein